MAEVADTRKDFLIRQRIANGQRQRNELLSVERPEEDVVMPLIRPLRPESKQTDEVQNTPAPVQGTHPIMLLSSTKPVDDKPSAFATFGGPVTGSYVPATQVSVNTESPPVISAAKLAYANIVRTMMELEQARAVLHESSGGMSPAIPLLRAVYDDLMTELPKIEP